MHNKHAPRRCQNRYPFPTILSTFSIKLPFFFHQFFHPFPLASVANVVKIAPCARFLLLSLMSPPRMLPAVATVGYCASQSSAYDPFRIEHARSAARKPAIHRSMALDILYSYPTAGRILRATLHARVSSSILSRLPFPADFSRHLSFHVCRPRPMLSAAEHIQDPERVVGPHGSADAITHGGDQREHPWVYHGPRHRPRRGREKVTPRSSLSHPQIVLFVTFRNGSKMPSAVTNLSFGAKTARFGSLSATRYPSTFYKDRDGR